MSVEKITLQLSKLANFALIQFPQNVPPKVIEEGGFSLLLNEKDEISNPKARKAIKISGERITWIGKND
jgi:hypothetical protein